MAAKELMFNKVTSPRLKYLTITFWTQVRYFKQFTLNLKLKIKQSPGMNNAQKTNSLKQSNKEKTTAMNNDLASGY